MMGPQKLHPPILNMGSLSWHLGPGWEAAKEGAAVVQTDHPHVGLLSFGCTWTVLEWNCRKGGIFCFKFPLSISKQRKRKRATRIARVGQFVLCVVTQKKTCEMIYGLYGSWLRRFRWQIRRHSACTRRSEWGLPAWLIILGLGRTWLRKLTRGGSSTSRFHLCLWSAGWPRWPLGFLEPLKFHLQKFQWPVAVTSEAWNVATGPDHEMDCCYWQCVWATQCWFLAASRWLASGWSCWFNPFHRDSRVVSRCESDIIKSKADVASGFRKTPVATRMSWVAQVLKTVTVPLNF